MAARRAALDELRAEVPALRQAMVVDLLTGVVLGRVGRTAADFDVAGLAEMLPGLLREVRVQVEGPEGTENLEFVEVSTERVSILVTVASETQEALALLADRSQPVALVTATLLRVARAYAERVVPSRRSRTPVPG
jgi:hypothetical protein